MLRAPIRGRIDVRARDFEGPSGIWYRVMQSQLGRLFNASTQVDKG